jgi:hypothetical protein
VVDQVVDLPLLVVLVVQVAVVEVLPLVARSLPIKVTLVVQETFITAVAVEVEEPLVLQVVSTQ